jgi:hypothetical protein
VLKLVGMSASFLYKKYKLYSHEYIVGVRYILSLRLLLSGAVSNFSVISQNWFKTNL